MDDAKKIEQEVDLEIAKSIEFSEKSKFPGKKELFQNIYAPKETVQDPKPEKDNQKLIRYVDSLGDEHGIELTKI